MMYTRLLATGFGTVLLAGQGVLAQPNCPEAHVCRQIIFRTQPNQGAQAVASANGGTIVGSLAARDTHVLQLPAQANYQAVLAAISADPRVLWAEPNILQFAPGGQTQSFFLSSTQHHQQQYAIELLGLPAAHLGSLGEGVRIAVLDSGIDETHPLLAGKIASGGFNFVEGTTDTRDLGNGLDDDSDTLIDEMTGHGTFVSGVLALAAPGAQIVPFKVLNSDGVGTAFWVAQAIDAARAEDVGIINISLGSNLPSQAIAEAVNEALAEERLVIASVGNHDRSEPPLYPAALPGVVAVAGTDALDCKAAFSDYGAYVGIAAPAVDIVGPVPGGTYGVASGTSFAAPWVSGTAALVLSRAPNLPRSTIGAMLANASIDITALNAGHSGQLGSGRLSVHRTVSLAPVVIPCYANCDGSTAAPMLNVADFGCFLQQFASGDPLANCDGSLSEPFLNIADFACFLQRFAAGCP